MAVEHQFANVLPPDVGKVLVVTLDTQWRSYDLGALAFADAPVDPLGNFFLAIFTTARLFYGFGPASGVTPSETAALGAGVAVGGFTTNACWEAPVDSQTEIYVDRTRQRWLYMKGGAAGLVRLRAASGLSRGE